MIKDLLQRYRKGLLVLLFCLLVLATCRTYIVLTDGFHPNGIRSQYPFNPSWEARALTPEEKVLLNEIFDQKFYYLGKGGQSYVFESRDERYVIKFFKQRHLQYPLWVYIPLPSSFTEMKKAKMLKKERRWDGLFKSCCLAFDKLEEETGVVFVHLNKTSNQLKPLIIVDKLGLEYAIDLDDFQFFVQKKATMVYPVITELMNQGDLIGAKKRLDQLIQVVVDRSHKGIKDRDFCFVPNIAFLEGRAVLTDVGGFVESEEIKQPEVYKQDFLKRTKKFSSWLHTKYPELEAYFVQKLQDL